MASEFIENRRAVLETRYIILTGCTLFPTTELIKIYNTSTKVPVWIVITIAIYSLVGFIISFKKNFLQNKWYILYFYIADFWFLFYALFSMYVNHFAQRDIATLIITISVILYTTLLGETVRLITFICIAVSSTIFMCWYGKATSDYTTFTVLTVIITCILMGYTSYSRVQTAKKLVSAHVNQEMIYLKISDNGKGLNSDFTPDSTGSFGLKLIQLLIKQIEGTFTYNSSGEGTNWEISFKHH